MMPFLGLTLIVFCDGSSPVLKVVFSDSGWTRPNLTFSSVASRVAVTVRLYTSSGDKVPYGIVMNVLVKSSSAVSMTLSCVLLNTLNLTSKPSDVFHPSGMILIV